ncbi:sensor histidine kinase [Actinomadura rayongensis]|uniref:sensor histidine kinase n=1 Tax=Actinomadura rayongensis TaxID=1429076 RepID=UPI00301D8A02
MIERRAWSIRLRLTLLATLVSALVCGGVAALIIATARQHDEDRRHERAVVAALRIQSEVEQDHVAALAAGRLPPALFQVVDAGGRVAASGGLIRGAPRIASFVPRDGDVYTARRLCPPVGIRGCVEVVAFRVRHGGDLWTVYVAHLLTPWYVRPRIPLLALGIAAVIVGATAFLTWRTVNRTLAPVGAIRTELAEITATSSGRRVPVPHNHDEIRLLAETVNATLDRLDGALEKQRRFTSDASHDLRSPITAARTQVEEALLAPDEVDWVEVAHGVLNSLERLQAIVTDLLELARLDAGNGPSKEIVDLAALVSIELGRAERTKEVVPDLAMDVTVRGERLRLSRLLTNLLDNAERHAESRIDVRVRAEGDTAVLEVQDDGDGIAEKNREVVFERFARLKASREKDANGTGLGLPIALQIARAHGGTLRIEDSPKGARFVLRLPRAARP